MLIAQRPSVTEDQLDEFQSRFVVEPLEPWFGYTIGNTLRRTPGAPGRPSSRLR